MNATWQNCFDYQCIISWAFLVAHWQRTHLSTQETWVQSLGWEDPLEKEMSWKCSRQPTQVFLPGKSHGQGSLVSYSPWSHKESDTTEWLSTAQASWICSLVFIMDFGEFFTMDTSNKLSFFLFLLFWLSLCWSIWNCFMVRLVWCAQSLNRVWLFATL